MQTITLLAVDEPQTTCREDAFLLERFDDGSVQRLTVASVIPPKNVFIDYKRFLANIFSHQGEQREYFLKKKTYVELGLKIAEPRHVLMAIFEFDTCNNFTIKVATGYAMIKIVTYDAFSLQPDFNDIKSGIEEFLFQDYHIDWKYKSGQGEEYWETKVTPARRLISSMLDMFNRAVSKFAHNKKIKTLRLTKAAGLQLKLHEEARFGGPLRRAISHVNVLNISASIEGDPLPYTHERLQGVLGDSYLIKP